MPTHFICLHILQEEIEDLQKERLSVSLAADIWGENGISILAIMAYWITPDFELKEKLLLAKPFSQVTSVASIPYYLCCCYCKIAPHSMLTCDDECRLGL